MTHRKAIGDYKKMMRKSLRNNPMQVNMLEFLLSLEKNEEVEKMYTINDLIDEYCDLEKEFVRINRTEISSFLPLLQSFSLRVASRHDHTMKKSVDDEKHAILSLYTAISNKMMYVDNYKDGGVVVDLGKYLQMVGSQIKELHVMKKEISVIQKQESYDERLEENIKNAKKDIDRIIGKLGDTFKELDAEISELLDKINHLRETTLQERKNQQKLKTRMKFQMGFSILKSIAAALPYSGPPAAIAGIALAGTLNFVENMMFDPEEMNRLSQKTILNITTMSADQESILKSFKSDKDKFNEIMKEVPDLEDPKQTKEFKDELKKLGEIKKRIKEIDVPSNLDALFTESLDVFNKVKNSQNLNSNQIKICNNAIEGINTAQIGVKLFEDFKGAWSKMKLANDSIQELNQQLVGLRRKPFEINDMVVPLFRSMKMKISGLNVTDPDITIDFQKWQLTNSLSKVKGVISDMVQELQFEGKFADCIQTLIEGVDISMDIHKSIELYSEQSRFGIYVADLHSNSDIKEQVLSKAVTEMNYLVISNIVFEQFDRVLNAYKQQNFPFAARFLKNYYIDPNSNFDNRNTKLYVENAAKMIAQIGNEKIRWEATYNIQKQMSTINSKKVSERRTYDVHSLRRPFYTWEYSRYRTEIEKLLSGEEIELDADIAKAIEENVVKFKEIGLYFNFHDKAIKSHFYETIQKFLITMRMSRKVFYRCNDEIYYTSLEDEFVFEYFIILDKNDELTFDPQNDAYEFILNNNTDIFLSPYTTWHIQLNNIDTGYKHLNEFKNKKVDLQLVSVGKFFKKDETRGNICNDPLYKHYNKFVPDPFKPNLVTSAQANNQKRPELRKKGTRADLFSHKNDNQQDNGQNFDVEEGNEDTDDETD